ncbi:MAG: hypothetical protein KGH63_01220 [Candidatus Micrarchaeota archaeon]|nr:hypothetical protein [Candidatus Micrarchaeota archaeon]
MTNFPSTEKKTPPAGGALNLLSRLSAAKLLSAPVAARQRIPDARPPFSQSSTATELKDRPSASSQSHYLLPNPVRENCQVRISDAAIAARAQTLDFSERRHSISHGASHVHFARTPSEAHGQWVLDALSSELPELTELFAPAQGMLVRTPRSARPQLRGAPEADHLIGPETDEPEKAYLVSVLEHASVYDSEGLTPTVRSLDWSSFSKHQRMAILYALTGKLARLHAAGYKAGDTGLSNLALVKGLDPRLRSAGQLVRLKPGLTYGIPELLYAYGAWRKAGLIDEKEARALLAYYLQQPGAMDHARGYLSGVKVRPYREGVPMVDQLHERLAARYLVFQALAPERQN